MLVSHESPISILDKSKQYNDYCYALVHLFETHPEYYNHFKLSLAQDREVLLDNSIFELGESFNPTKYAKYVEELKPTFYIVPDVLENSTGTMTSFEMFVNNFPNLESLKIGVVQGKTWQELVDCYRFMDKHADYIAISFDYSWYDTVTYSPRYGRLGQLDRWAAGRSYFIKRLISEGIWNNNKPHHLLGCSLAHEFRDYKNIPSIRSCDTSNPVVAALHDHRYIAEYGLTHKPSTLLADLINHNVSSDELEMIKYNTGQFKKIISNG